MSSSAPSATPAAPSGSLSKRLGLVGAVLALSPVIGPWLATGAVVAVLFVLVALFTLRLRSKFNDIRAVFDDAGPLDRS